jgi:hypothetical protein
MKTPRPLPKRSTHATILSTLSCLTITNQSLLLAAAPSPKQQPSVTNGIVALYSKGDDAKAMTLVDNPLRKHPGAPPCIT